MKKIVNKKYVLIDLGLIGVYLCLFVKSMVDGRFFDNGGYGKKLLFGGFLSSVVFLTVLVTVFSLIALAFRKLQLTISYIVFALLSGAFMLFLPFQGTGTTWISLPWYFLLEFQIGIFIIILFAVILIISLLIKFCRKKYANRQ
jgi:uncharacterized paraquat-inducible protein A